MSTHKKIVFTIIVFSFFITSFEMTFRVYFASTTHSLLPLFYGINKAIEFEILSLSESDYLCYKKEEIRTFNYQKYDSDLKKKVTFFLGGSTTKGYNCSPNSSSWPEQLAYINKNIEVFNMAKNGTNSDFALKKLKSEITKNNFPEIIFFANYINELDVLTKGFALNKDFFEKNYPEYHKKTEHKKISKIKHFLLRLDKTLTGYFLSYITFDYLVKNKILRTNKFFNNEVVERNNKDIQMALQNYKINLEGIYHLAKSVNSLLVIVRPPIAWGLYKNNHFKNGYYDWVVEWDRHMIRLIEDFSKNEGILFIDTQLAYKSNEKSKQKFCDGVHQTLLGHKIMAKYINKVLASSNAITPKLGLN